MNGNKYATDDRPVEDAASSPFFSRILTNRHNSTRRLGLLALVLAIGVGGLIGLPHLFAVSNDGDAEGAGNVRILPVAVLELDRQASVALQRAYTGLIVPRRTAALSFERGGLVTDVLVDDGAEVKTNQTLARLDVAALTRPAK